MKIFKATVKGEFHLDHNEEYVVGEKIGRDTGLIGVLDGCSAGEESHFASTLTGKILKKISREYDYKESFFKSEDDLRIFLKKIIQLLFQELKAIKQQLNLNRYELLSTLVIALVNHKKCKAELLTIGDGLICCNGVTTEFDQDNEPDYLGYHLEEDFDIWYKKQTQFLPLENIRKLSISTDGIYTFESTVNENPIQEDIPNLQEYFFNNNDFINNENMLSKKLILLKNELSISPNDDFSIVRIDLEN
ncbi:MAG: protein phosphatase 2C domain-containing protein [Saprospiraceae bacterium]